MSSQKTAAGQGHVTKVPIVVAMCLPMPQESCATAESVVLEALLDDVEAGDFFKGCSC